jgi:hypothetical protein
MTWSNGKRYRQELLQRITESAGCIKDADKVTRKATNSILRRAELCIQNDGHFGKQSVQRNRQLTVFGITNKN